MKKSSEKIIEAANSAIEFRIIVRVFLLKGNFIFYLLHPDIKEAKLI